MGVATNKRQRQTYLTRLHKVLTGFGAWRKNEESYPNEYTLTSLGGEWSVSVRPNDGDVFTRFEHPEKLQDVLTGVNIYSGKYNLHFIDTTPEECLNMIIRTITRVVPIVGTK
jgi:hypothetical protein